MNTATLIALLQKYPPETEVKVEIYDPNLPTNLSAPLISVDPDSVGVVLYATNEPDGLPVGDDDAETWTRNHEGMISAILKSHGADVPTGVDADFEEDYARGTINEDQIDRLLGSAQ